MCDDINTRKDLLPCINPTADSNLGVRQCRNSKTIAAATETSTICISTRTPTLYCSCVYWRIERSPPLQQAAADLLLINSKVMFNAAGNVIVVVF